MHSTSNTVSYVDVTPENGEDRCGTKSCDIELYRVQVAVASCDFLLFRELRSLSCFYCADVAICNLCFNFHS